MHSSLSCSPVLQEIRLATQVHNVAQSKQNSDNSVTSVKYDPTSLLLLRVEAENRTTLSIFNGTLGAKEMYTERAHQADNALNSHLKGVNGKERVQIDPNESSSLSSFFLL